MIFINVRGNQFTAELDLKDPSYKSVYLILRSLLTVKNIKGDLYSLSYQDFKILKQKLDSFGLVSGRKMSKAALALCAEYEARYKRNADIKEGIHNDHVKSLFDGKLKTTPYPDQVTGISYLVNNRRAGLFDSMGVGKAQSTSSQVLTPEGWRAIGELIPGDKIMNAQGTESRVTGVYPQGNLPMYRVTFSDGACTECCDDHLWAVKMPNDKSRGNPSRILKFDYLKRDLFTCRGVRKYFIPMVAPIQFSKKELPMDPYLLGCILGDGCTSSGAIEIITGDYDILPILEERLPDECTFSVVKDTATVFSRRIVRAEGCSTYRNPAISILRELGLMGKTASKKFIPEIYKLSSVQDRFDMLSGLLDTDGHVFDGSGIMYVSSSKELVDGVIFLVRSLGGTATVTSSIPTYTYEGERRKGQRSYRANVAMPGVTPPFRLTRRAKAWRPRTKYPPARAFDQVEYIGEKEAVCIEVDSPDSLYVTDDFIVTHNTFQALGYLKACSSTVRKTLIVAPKSVLLGFGREIAKHTDLKAITVPAGRKVALDFVRKNKNGNWDIMLVHPENLIAAGAARARIYGDVLKVLKTIKFDVIIVDEFHMYQNMEAKRTKCVMALINEVRDRLGKPCRAIAMTGTPISESPANAYVFLKLLGSEYLPQYTHFENHFTIKKDQTVYITDKRGKRRKIVVKKVVGYKNLSELKERIEQVSIRRTKADMVGFPDQVFVIRDVELAGNQKKLYKAVCGKVKSGLPKDTKINIDKFFTGSGDGVRLRQLLNHPDFLDEKGEAAKYKEIDNILEDLFADPEQKVVIWTEYRKAIDLIYDRWNEKYGVIKVRGGVDITEEMVKKFEDADRPRIAACIPAKAGTGVDWLARARTAIYIERPYSSNHDKQSLDRIHRRVKTEGELSRLDKIRSQPATVIFLNVPGSIDEMVSESLGFKGDVSDAVTVSNKQLVNIGRSDLLKYLR